MNLDDAAAEGALRGIEQWFEAIFRLAESDQGGNPAARLATREGLR